MTEAGASFDSFTQTFARLFEHVADNVLIVDASGCIEYANRAFLTTTGYTSEELVGRSASLMRSGVHPAEVYEELDLTLRSGKAFRYILTSRRKDGSLYEEGVVMSPIKDERGQVSRYIMIGRVIDAFRRTYGAFTVLANNLPAGVFVLRDGRLFFVNDELCRFLNRSPQDLIGRDWLNFADQDDRLRLRLEAAEMISGARKAPIEYRLSVEGGARWVMETRHPVAFREAEYEAGEFVAAYLVDITDRKLAETRLEHALSLHQATVESTTDGIVVVDRDGRMVSANQRFREIWNLFRLQEVREDQSGVFDVMLAQLSQPERLKQRLREIAKNDGDVFDSFELLDGRTLEVFSRPQLVNGVKLGRVWSWRDVTERRRFETALLRLASRDSLTSLYNRRKLNEEMERALASSEPKALMLLDLDGLKEINDTLGHQAGDDVLVQVARVLEDRFPSGLVARYGGDEFAVFLAGVRAAEARTAAQEVLDALCFKTYLAGGVEVSLTASIGIAIFPAHGRTPEELVAQADSAMYSAKSAGGDMVCVYSPGQREYGSMLARRVLQLQLLEAVEERRWRLYSQRALALNGGDVLLDKLHVRFLGQDGRLLPKPRNAPARDHPGALRTVNRWLLEEAAALLQRPPGRDDPLVLSFSLPWQALTDEGFVDLMVSAMQGRRTDAARVLLELAGSDGLPSGRRIRRTLELLRPLGYRFLVADALGPEIYTMLKTMQLDFVQVDSLWVKGVRTDPVMREIVASLARIAASLGVKTLADDVTDRTTLDVLRSSGVDYARGASVARPRPVPLLLPSQRQKRAA